MAVAMRPLPCSASAPPSRRIAITRAPQVRAPAPRADGALPGVRAALVDVRGARHASARSPYPSSDASGVKPRPALTASTGRRRKRPYAVAPIGCGSFSSNGTSARKWRDCLQKSAPSARREPSRRSWYPVGHPNANRHPTLSSRTPLNAWFISRSVVLLRHPARRLGRPHGSGRPSRCEQSAPPADVPTTGSAAAISLKLLAPRVARCLLVQPVGFQ
jgi:hypothetical protein